MIPLAILLAVAGQDGLDPDSRVITAQSDRQHVQTTVRFCLRAAAQPEGISGVLDSYATRHRLTPAEKNRLIDDCNIALVAAIDAKLGIGQ